MTLLLALLLSLEQSYGPYARPANGGDATVAVARGGTLLAWSEGNRIRVGMLDAQARLSSDIRTLPVRTGRSAAVAPRAASDGLSFFIAWSEHDEHGLQRTMGMVVAFDGMPLGTPRQYGKGGNVTPDNFPAHLLWDGEAYRLWAAGRTHTIAPDGEVLSSAGVKEMPSGVAAANGVLATSASKISLVHCGFGWCWWRSDVIWNFGAREGGRVRLGEAGGFPGMQRELPLPVTTLAATGDRFVLMWPQDGIIHYYLVPGGNSNRVAASAERGVQPSLACDDAHCMIAYARSENVHAFAFEADQLLGPETLAVAAATERTERVPQVHALGQGRFLVLYRSDGDDGQRFAWRVIGPEPPPRKARAMR